MHKGEHELERREHNSQNKHDKQSGHHRLNVLGQILQHEKFPDEIHEKDNPDDAEADAIHVIASLPQILIEEAHTGKDAQTT